MCICLYFLIQELSQTNVCVLALSATPGYVPPPATFDSEAPEGVPSINAGGPVRKKNGKEFL